MTWLKTASRLMYPGVVAALGFSTAILVGPLAFAIREEIYFPASMLGTTFALFFIASAIFSSLGSYILAKVRAGTLTRVGLGLSSLTCIGMGFAADTIWILGLTTAAGIVNGVATPAVSVTIVQTVPPRRQGLGFGIRMAAIPMVAVVAAMGAVLVSIGEVSWRAVFVVSGCFGLAVLAVAVAFRPRGRGGGARMRQGGARRASGRPKRALVLLGVAGFFSASGTGFYFTFMVDSLIDAELDPALAAGIVSGASWVSIASRLGAGVLTDRIRGASQRVRTIIIHLLVAASGMALLAGGSDPVLLAVAVFLCLGIGMSWGGILHHAGVTLFSDQAARAASYTQTGNFAGTVAGSLLFGLLAQEISFTVAWIPPIGSVLLAAGLLLLVIREIRRA